MLRKRMLAALLCLCLVMGLGTPAYGAEEAPERTEVREGTGEVPEPEAWEDADALDFYALEAPALRAMAPGARSGSVAYAVEGGNIYFDPGTGEIVDCDGSVTKAVIPSSIGGAAVTGIGNSAFLECGGLTSVTIPGSVTGIGPYAFEGCSGLTEVTLPGSVTGIGYRAFYDCAGLTEVRIPDSVTSIGGCAFQNCSGLTGVTIPNSVTEIGFSAFEGCAGLMSVTISEGATGISASAFRRCEKLAAFVVDPDNDEYASVGGVLFNKGKTILYCFPGGKEPVYTIPEGVTSIGVCAFEGCGGLTAVRIPGSVTSIGNNAFGGCSGLTKVRIPGSVTSIGSSAFVNCTSLTEVTIPGSVTSIGACAFQNCNGLKNVIIPGSVTSIEQGAFSMSGLKNVIISEGVNTIKGDAFAYCPNLTNVAVPRSVTSIWLGAFRDCRKLNDVYYAGNWKQWRNISKASLNNYLTSANIHCDFDVDRMLLDSEEMFLTQSQDGLCAVAANAMMLRRRAYLNGESGWAAVTEAAVKPSAWDDGAGMRLSFSYEGKRVESRDTAKQSAGEKKGYLMSLLESHPEGVAVYCRGGDGPDSGGEGQRAVLLTDYDAESGMFYCADPAGSAPRGRILFLESAIPGDTQDERISNIHQIWYIRANTIKREAVTTVLRSDGLTEMRVTVDGTSLNSSGVSGTASNEYAAMTAVGAGQERRVEAAIDRHGVPEESGIGVELLGTGEGSITFTVTHIYSDGTSEQQVFKNVPVTGETVSRAENVRPQSTVLLSVTDSGAGGAKCWSAEPGEEAGAPSQDFVKPGGEEPGGEPSLTARLLESSNSRAAVQLTGGTLPENARVFAAHQEGGRFTEAALGTRSGDRITFDCPLAAGDRLFILSGDGLVPLMGPAVEIA